LLSVDPSGVDQSIFCGCCSCCRWLLIRSMLLLSIDLPAVDRSIFSLLSIDLLKVDMPSIDLSSSVGLLLCSLLLISIDLLPVDMPSIDLPAVSFSINLLSSFVVKISKLLYRWYAVNRPILVCYWCLPISCLSIEDTVVYSRQQQ
jgi:hypothetical protein